MKYFYTYEISIENEESQLNGCKYYGKHETYNLDDGYLGSGIIIGNYRKKYGDKGIKKTIIDFYSSSDELNNAEKLLVESKHIELGERCLNLTDGGDGGDVVKYMSEERLSEYKSKISSSNKGKLKGRKLSDDTKHKIGIASKERWKDKEFRQKMSCRVITDATRQKLSESHKGLLVGDKNPMYGKSIMLGKHHTEESKRKISEKAKERYKDSTKNPMFGKHHSEAAKKVIGDKNRGLIRSEETKRKISEAQRGMKKKPYPKRNYNCICKFCGQEFIGNSPNHATCPSCKKV